MIWILTQLKIKIRMRINNKIIKIQVNIMLKIHLMKFRIYYYNNFLKIKYLFSHPHRNHKNHHK